MKNFTKLLLIVSGLMSLSFAKATVISVTVQNMSFTPASFTANIGDTIKWVWVNGTHTTTSLSIPTGATSWDNPMNSTNTTFEYVVKVPGTYNYWCSIHTTMMEGSFTVSAVGIPVVSNTSQKVIAMIYPNPANNLINVHLNNVSAKDELSITNMLGQVIAVKPLANADNKIDVSNWKKGVYFYHLKSNEEMMDGKFEVQ